mmetsp:Transcript_23161/g.72554  ORF Transcript_23161/g.72554 Transcript_23161/m.72554 type:complete len:405 (-) Transcript_23161:159-1373(-)
MRPYAPDQWLSSGEGALLSNPQCASSSRQAHARCIRRPDRTVRRPHELGRLRLRPHGLRDDPVHRPPQVRCPFKGDSCGFFTFRSELLGAMKDEGTNRMRAAGDAARARGDVKCAEFADRAPGAVLDILRENGLLRDGAAQSRAAHQPSTMQLDRFSTPVRHIREIHEVCVRGAGTLVPAVAAPCLAPRSDASHLAATPPSAPPRPPHGSLRVGRQMETAPAPLFDHLCLPAVNDPHTWPKDPDALPAFTKSVQLCTPRTIQDLADEWFRGIRGGAPIKFLEEFYGTRKRSGKSKYSWRSPKHRSDAFKKAYNTRSIFYLFFEEQIAQGVSEADAVRDLQSRADVHLGEGESSSWSAILKIQGPLIKQMRPESHEKNRKRAMEAHQNKKNKQQRTPGPANPGSE